MIPINFEINLSKVKVTVAFKLMIYRQTIVHIITTHNWLTFRAVGQATFFTKRIFSSEGAILIATCPSSFVRHIRNSSCVVNFVLMKSRTSLKMGHVGSKTRSLGHISEKPYAHSRGHIFSPIIMKLGQNVCLDKQV